MTAAGYEDPGLSGQLPRPNGDTDLGHTHVGNGNHAQMPAVSGDREQHAHAVFKKGGDAYDGDADSEEDEQAGAGQAANCSQANAINIIGTDDFAHQMAKLGQISHEPAMGDCGYCTSLSSRQVSGVDMSLEQTSLESRY